jgi:hypothetical protein
MKISAVYVSILSMLLMSGCGVQIKPLQSTIDALNARNNKKSADPRIVFKFFEEDNLCDEGCEYSQYGYPEPTSTVSVSDVNAKSGEVSAQFDLDQKDYSGGCIYIGTMVLNVEPYYSKGAFDFWIKGAVGGEKCFVVISDEDKSEGLNVEVKVPIEKYAQVTTDWTHVTIPLHDFGKRGSYYVESNNTEIPKRINWGKIYGFLLTTDKGQNPAFKVWVDNVCIMKDVFDPAPEGADIYWDEKDEIIPAPPLSTQPAVTATDTFFNGSLAKGVSIEVYGGKTGTKIQKTTEPQTVSGVYALYMDNNDDAGVTVDFGRSIDVSQLRENKGGVAFWAKFVPGVSHVFFGVLDSNADNKLIQTNVTMSDYAKVDTTWQYFMVPLKDFSSQGAWWDEVKNAEVSGEVSWKRLSQVVFYTDKLANRVEEGSPASIYLSNLILIKEVPGFVDPDVMWKAFKSTSPDLTLFDFEKPEDANWDASPGDESEMFCKVIDLDEETPEYGKKALEIEYSLNDWADAGYNFVRNSTAMQKRDWSKYWALRFSIYTDKDEDVVAVQINDSGKEAFYTVSKIKMGWNEVLLPFRLFKKDPNNQESDAEKNGKFDLQSVVQIVFRPITAGTMGKFKLDNVKLTNVRELK